ncbi:MAG TPA: D-alanine--D-alanine ligase [Nitriliruptorales bacterium]|nr:D-alanine--D-alanine ligase [Nitriliruptorales bacterium]
MTDTTPRPHVAVLAGGVSLEREVSLRSGARVADALEDRGYPVVRLDVDSSLVRHLAEGDFDVAFIALHGGAGEDGTIQSILELLELPYTGPDTLASALAWDKPIAKGLYRRVGIATPEQVSLSAQAFRDMGVAAAIDRIADELGLPLVVKPATGGSSLGLTHLERPQELPAAVVHALSYADAVLIEQHITGVEVAVSVLDGTPLPAVEIRPKQGAYDFAARYTAGATEFHVPARLDADVLERCAQVAVAAYDAIGARHVSRADLIVDLDGVPWLLELDTCPGLTETSLLPLAARAAGMDLGDLAERLVTLALSGGWPEGT